MRALNLNHDNVLATHLGIRKTLSRLLESVWWPGMVRDTEIYIKSCHGCLTRKSPSKNARANLKPIESGPEPFSYVQMDIKGPLPLTLNGNRFILVLVDTMTKFVTCKPLKTQDTNSTAEAFLEIICGYGIPAKVGTDRGQNFISDTMKRVYEMLGVKKLTSTAYHPETQGLVERTNYNLGQCLSFFVSRKQDDWDLYLPLITYSLNTTTQDSIKQMPFVAMFGRTPPLLTHFEFDINYFTYSEDEDFAFELRRRLQLIWKMLTENNKKAQQKMATHYNKKAEDHTSLAGDLVYVHNPHVPKGRSFKLSHPWFGPYQITRADRYPVLSIKPCSNLHASEETVHCNRVKKFVGETALLGLDLPLCENPDEDRIRSRDGPPNEKGDGTQIIGTEDNSRTNERDVKGRSMIPTKSLYRDGIGAAGQKDIPSKNNNITANEGRATRTPYGLRAAPARRTSLTTAL